VKTSDPSDMLLGCEGTAVTDMYYTSDELAREHPDLDTHLNKVTALKLKNGNY
jgi:hypothetical protein